MTSPSARLLMGYMDYEGSGTAKAAPALSPIEARGSRFIWTDGDIEIEPPATKSARLFTGYSTKFNPHWRQQPRRPRGTPTGGEWTTGGGGGGGAGLGVGIGAGGTSGGGEPPKPEPPAAPLPRRSARPVSDSIAYHSSVTGPHRPIVDDALETIDGVHRDGRLTPVPVKIERLVDSLGVYAYVEMGDKLVPNRISLSPTGTHPRLTIVHEVGHFVDQQGFGQGKGYASAHDPAPEWVALRDAMDASPTMRRLNALKTGPNTVSTRDSRGRAQYYTVDKNYISYLTSRHETFARAYSQWVTVRSGNAMMRHDLERRRADTRKSRYLDVWDDEEFRPIAAAMDTLFARQGWLPG